MKRSLSLFLVLPLYLLLVSSGWAQIANYHYSSGTPIVYTEGVPFQIQIGGAHSGFCGENWHLAFAFSNLPPGWVINSIVSDNPVHGTGPFVQNEASERFDAIVEQNCDYPSSSAPELTPHYISPGTTCIPGGAPQVTSYVTITITPASSGASFSLGIYTAVFCDCPAQLESTTCNMLRHSASYVAIRPSTTILSPGFIGTDQAVCTNVAPNTLTNLLAPSSGTPPYSYQWQQANDPLGPWTDISPSGNSDTYSPAASAIQGAVYYRRRVLDAALPTNIAYSNVVSVTTHALPAAAIDPVPPVTCNSSIDLTPSATNGTGSWSIESAPPGSTASFSGNTVQGLNAAGSYTLRYTVSNSYCPPTWAEVTVTRDLPPVADAGPDEVICQDGHSLSPLATGGGGAWTVVSAPEGAQVTFPGSTPNYADGMTAAGAYTFRYTVAGSAACGDASDEVTVFRQPSALTFTVTELDPLPGFTAARQYSLNAPVAQGSNITWEFRNGTPATYTGLVPPPVQYDAYGDYEVGVVVTINPPPHACVIAHTSLISVHPPVPGPQDPLRFPNAFSPNNDGINDFFHPLGGPPQEYVIQIFNRWGVPVYEGRQVLPGWDGNAPNGKPAPEGVYVYRAWYTMPQGGAQERAGTITLLR
ncbi:MAG: gliding motility-associated C-terminal domain-containing protein [Bacteroidetes bacterium]|nr:gliding motility-associated C-terminal domain-containing protein [Bacteroidota bacterium]